MEHTNKMKFGLWLSILFSFSLHAQTTNTPPSIAWQKCLGGTNDDVINCVKPTSDSGYICAGSSGSDYLVIKLNASGDLVWQHFYGGMGTDNGNSVVSTPDGGYAVVGSSNSPNSGDVTGNHGLSDYWLIKINSQGTLQWQKSYGGSLGEVPTTIQLTADSGFVIAGRSFSNNGNVSGNHGDADIWVVKVDMNGTLQWQKSYGGAAFEIANDIRTTNDGGYIVAGYTRSQNGDVTNAHGQEDYWVLKLDGNGNLQWQKTLGGSGGDLASAIQPMNDGSYAICGLSHSRDFDVTDHLAEHDMWIAKIDTGGTLQWAHCFGGTDGDNGVDIKQDVNGTLIATAYTASIDSDVTNNHGLYDMWVTGIDVSGNLLWEETLGGSADEYPRSLQIINDGQYVVGGYTYSNDGDVTGNHGGSDGWVVKLSTSTTCNTVFYLDADGDGYGDPLTTTMACSVPSGYSGDHTDCNDGDASIHPHSAEICNAVDDNCNGDVDEGIITAFYVDADGDGYGNATVSTVGCSAPNGYVTNQTDCDDTRAATHPGASEVCNGIDDDCNNLVDDNSITASITPSGTATICSGTTLFLTANTGTGLTYQWKKNGAIISGATNSTYGTKVAGSYTVTIASGSCTATSAPTVTSVSATPNATITPSGTAYVCLGVPLTMNANTGNGLSYQWKKGTSNIPDATASSYTTPVTGSYKVVVSNSAGCSKISLNTTLSNYPAPTLKITNTGSLNICSAGSVQLNAKFISGYTYQWYKNNVAISNATSTTYTATQAGTYFYQATTSNGCTGNSANKVVTGCRVGDDNANINPVLTIYPNPVADHFIVELHLENEFSSKARIELINTLGDIVFSEDVDIYEGTLLHTITIKKELPDALYFVKVAVGDCVFFQRLICQR